MRVNVCWSCWGTDQPLKSKVSVGAACFLTKKFQKPQKTPNVNLIHYILYLLFCLFVCLNSGSYLVKIVFVFRCDGALWLADAASCCSNAVSAARRRKQLLLCCVVVHSVFRGVSSRANFVVTADTVAANKPQHPPKRRLQTWSGYWMIPDIY